jgi:hypothetical protein
MTLNVIEQICRIFGPQGGTHEQSGSRDIRVESEKIREN